MTHVIYFMLYITNKCTLLKISNILLIAFVTEYKTTTCSGKNYYYFLALITSGWPSYAAQQCFSEIWHTFLFKMYEIVPPWSVILRRISCFRLYGKCLEVKSTVNWQSLKNKTITRWLYKTLKRLQNFVESCKSVSKHC